MADKTLLGTGKIAIDGRIIENPTTIALNIATTEITLANLGTPGGGNYRSKERIDSMSFNATVHDFSGAMLAEVLQGTSAAYTGAAIADEAQTARAQGYLIPTDHMIDTSVAVTITGHVQDTDYTVTPAGVIPIVGAGISEDDVLAVSYTSLDSTDVQLANSSSVSREVVFDGYNDDDGSAMRFVLFKAKVSTSGDVNMVGTEYGDIPLSAKIEKDDTKGTGLSAFGVFEIGDAA